MKLLAVIDMQNDFVTGALGTPQAQAILPAVKKRVEQALAEGAALVFTQDTHGPQYPETQEGRRLPVPHCIQGTPGWEIVPALRPYLPRGRIFEKPSFGSWELAQAALEGMKDRYAVLLGNHGVIAGAGTLKDAFDNLRSVEVVAELYYRTRSLGEPKLISSQQMDQVLEKFQTYGQPAESMPQEKE